MSKSINPQPLAAAVAAIATHNADIETANARKASIEAEVADVMATANPNDEKLMERLALRKTQADIIPRFIARSEEKRPALFDKVADQFVALRKDLGEALLADRTAFRAEWKRAFAPLFKSLKKDEMETLLNAAVEVMTLSSTFPRLPCDNNGLIGTRGYTDDSQARLNHWKSWEDHALYCADELLAIARDYKPFDAASVKG